MRCRHPSYVFRFLLIFAAVFSQSEGGEAKEHVVRIVSDYENLRMAFEPKYLEIGPGDDVTWVNEADEEHNVITFPDGFPNGAQSFRSPIMTRADQRWSHRFTVAGTYEYHCIPHLPMGMHGVIIVEHISKNNDFHKPSSAEVKAYRDLLMRWFDEDEFETLEREDRASANEIDVDQMICRSGLLKQ